MKFMKMHQLYNDVNCLPAGSILLMELSKQNRLDVMGIIAAIGR
ncbi:hypothetical protein N8471_02100 [Polaribacter sp.]|nr:hypothetical protein [Polaribacter sp.]